MSGLCRGTCLVVIFSCLLESSTFGQRNFTSSVRAPLGSEFAPGRVSDGAGNVFYSANPVALAQTDEFRDELQISDDQLKALYALNSEGGRLFRELRQAVVGDYADVQVAARAAIYEKVHHELFEILSPLQANKVRQLSIRMHLRNRGLRSLVDPDVIAKLGLTDSQVVEIARADDTIEKRAAEKLEKFIESEEKKAFRQLLSLEQLRMLESLVGQGYVSTGNIRRPGSKDLPRWEIMLGSEAFPADPISLVDHPRFQKELELTEAQLKELNERRAAAGNQAKAYIVESTDVGSDLRKVVRDANDRLKKSIETSLVEVLSPSQYERLSKLTHMVKLNNERLENQPIMVLLDAEFAKLLEISDSQRVEIVKTGDEMRNLFASEAGRIVDDERRKEVESILTKDQLTAFMKMVGQDDPAQRNPRRK